MAESTQKKSTSWWIPAATFVVGLVLGGGVIAATSSGDDAATTSAASPSPSTSASSPGVSASPSTPADATLTVPGECLQVAEDSQKVLDLVNDAVAAVRDLDASALSDVVREIQSSQDTLTKQTEACKDSVEAPSVP